MKLHVLVEGSSEKALLSGWLPRLLPAHAFKIYPHQGKGKLTAGFAQKPDPKHQGLLDQLPAKLRAWQRTLNPATDRIVILVDADDDDCADLKKRLKAMWQECCPKLPEAICIAVEETEAFYLGDEAGVRKAFPSAQFKRTGTRYKQDSVCGTWEFFQQVIGTTFVDKVGWASAMAPTLTVTWNGKGANKSPSFCFFCKTLTATAGERVPSSRG